MRKQLARDNKTFPSHLIDIPQEQWPIVGKHIRVMRSNRFLVQVFEAPLPAICRISVCKTEVTGMRWTDGISWDDLQEIKSQCGYEDHDAVEIFPAEIDIVNVANMRHLWVMKDELSFKWRKN